MDKNRGKKERELAGLNYLYTFTPEVPSTQSDPGVQAHFEIHNIISSTGVSVYWEIKDCLESVCLWDDFEERIYMRFKKESWL